jgi:large subunit ribosomal protein L7/L12
LRPSAYPIVEQEVKPKEKIIFNVTLEKFDAAAKPKIIKEIKNLIPNMNLMEV